MITEEQYNHIFDYIAVFERENKIFVAAHEPQSRRIFLYLINKQNEEVYIRNGTTNEWAKIYNKISQTILENVYTALENHSIPIYRLKETTVSECFY